MHRSRLLVNLSVLLLVLLSACAPALGQKPKGSSAQKPRSGAQRGVPQQAKAKYKGVWEPVNYEQPIEFRSVYFVDAKTGWAAGAHGTIVRTRDAGKTWETQMGGDPQNDEQAFDNLYFIDERQGWVMGPTKSVVQRKLFATSDGGETWRPVGTICAELLACTDYAFTSANSGVFLTGGKIFHTKDGGKKWREALPKCEVQTEVDGVAKQATCSMKSVRFVSENVGYAAGAASGGTAVVMKTQNGGASWDYLWVQPDVGHRDEDYFKQTIFFLDERNGYLVLPRAGKILKTTDGGESWEELTATAKGALRFADPEVGWVMEGGKWTWTTDGGKHWNSREFSALSGAESFSLPARQRGYVAGRGGMIYRYSVVPAGYTSEGMIEAPAMTSASAEQMTQRLAKMKSGVGALRTKLAAAQKKAGGTSAKSSAATSSGSAKSGGAKGRPATGSTGSAATSAESAESSAGETSGETAEEQPAEGATEAGSGGESAESAAEEGGFVQDCCPEQLKEVESTVQETAAELPKFGGQFRNLNLFSVGLKMVQDFMNRGKELKSAFAELRGAKDADSAMTALNKLAGSADSLTQEVTARTSGESPEEE